MLDKPLTEKQQSFLDALFDPEIKGNIRKAMNAAGYSENTPVNIVVQPLKKQIIEAAEHILALNAPKAAMSLSDAMDNPSSVGMNNKLAAANSVLDRVGLGKRDLADSNVSKGAIVLLPPKNGTVNISINSSEDNIIDVTPNK